MDANLIKRAGAEIKNLRAKVASLEKKLGYKEKFATAKLGKKKLADVVNAVVEEVKSVLEEKDVPQDVVTEAVDVVEAAVTEAVAQAPEAGSTEAGSTSEAKEVVDNAVSEEVKDELAELATSDEETEEVKSAALKLLKAKTKSAFGREIVNVLKKLSSSSYNLGGFSGRKSSSANLGKNSSGALEDLKKFIR